MKILFPHTDSFGGFGGIAKFNRDFLTALCSLPECEEVIALPRLVSKSIGALPEKLTFFLAGLGGKLKYVIASLNTAWHNRPFTLVICGHINLLPIAWLCSRIAGGRLGLIIHGIDAWKPTRSWLANKLIQQIDFFISVSEFTLEKFCNWSDISPAKGHILPNCVDMNSFSPGPKSKQLLSRYMLNGKKIILTVGRMSADERYKGFDEIIEALPHIACEVPEIAYLIVGDGNDRSRLEQKAADLKVADRVVFAGSISDEEKVAHYRLADVFAMPGRGEGFGIVYLEAMACGVPVVASHADASREAVRNGMLGRVVNPDNSSELIHALTEGLSKEKVVPNGMEYFSCAMYRNRVQVLLNQTWKSASQQPGNMKGFTDV